MLARGLVIVVLLTAFGMGVVWQRVEVTRLGYAVQDLKRQRRVLEEASCTLTCDISALSAPDRIMRILRENEALLAEPSIIVQLSNRGAQATETPQ